MGLLAALSVMALSLGAATRADLAQTRRFQDETTAELLSKAGIEWAIHYLNTVERQGTLWQAPWYVQSAMFQARPLGPGTFDVRYTDPSGELHYGLQDEEARVNMNTAPATLLAALPGVGQELAEAIVEHLQQQPWSAPEELLQRGLVTASVWRRSAGQTVLSSYLTVWGSGKSNVNTASPMVLAALPGITPAMVAAIMRYRQGDDRQLGTADIILLGELRDLETISLAITAAETGHLVFGTLHTRTAASTVDRLIDVFPPDQQGQIRTMLAETLTGVIAQQLLIRADGQGRLVAVEILVGTTALANLVREGKTYQIPSLIQTGRREGMQTMDQAILEHLRSKQITPQEAYRKAIDKDTYRQYLERL